MHVAYQGEPGAFSEYAAVRFFGEGIVLHPKPSFDAVYEALNRQDVQYAALPIENSLFGSVHVNYDLLRKYAFPIIGELKLRVKHNLMAPTGENLSSIRKVYSHWQALGQCQDYLRMHVPHAEVIDAYDTAGAAKMIADGQLPHCAAIASKRAAQHYGLNILAESIESDHQNFTRFLMLQHPSLPLPAPPAGVRQKTSLVFAHKENIAGALFKSLAVFALRDLDLIKIESRPLVGSPWVYLFYLDIAGSTTDHAVQNALDHLAELSAFVHVLGTYPEGFTVDD